MICSSTRVPPTSLSTSKNSSCSLVTPRGALGVRRGALVARSTQIESAVLVANQKREAETLARRAAYEASRAKEIAAERDGLPWWELDCPANMINVACLEDLRQRVEAAPGLIIVHFFAPECYACRSMQPKLRQIARDNSDVTFLKVNGLTGDLQQYCELMQITRIPYFHFYRSNKRVAEFSANMRPDKLALLRAEIAAHKVQPVQAADSPEYRALEA